jgi:hypothetical protein
LAPWHIRKDLKELYITAGQKDEAGAIPVGMIFRISMISGLIQMSFSPKIGLQNPMF